MLCLYGGSQAPDKLYRLYESCQKDMPMVILLFGVLTYSRRMELYHLMLETRASFLVVDDMILATICESRDQLLLPQLYSLAVPFSVQSMYTSSLGVVYPEMFYGRDKAKGDLGLFGNVCAVYGGRQLGKTALLKNIELRQHQPKDDHFVYYMKLPTETVVNTDLLLTNLIKNCISRDILPAGREYPDMESLLTDIGIWIQQKNTRKLLLLLDEADQFLLTESKENFSVTSKINGLMTTTNLQFKVVFAGLHNVYRTFSMPNHPLVHWGEPISIGPLLNEELQDAINLIRQPFEVMGYRFESLDVIIRILAETNYYPSLIQVFCKSLHNYLTANLRDKKNTSLPAVIYMENIEDVLNDLALKEEISQRFMWTLNLDERYKAIALSIAFDAANAAQEETSNDIVKGYDLHWIKAEMNKWPDLFAGHSSLEDIRGLCDELVQLGILCYVFENRSRYTLRTVNILNMLGTQENILTEMYGLYEKKYDYTTMYNSKLSRRMFKDDGKCYPFTDQQIDAIFNSRGLKFVAGNHALGFDLIEKCLKELLASEFNKQKAYTLAVYSESFPELSELGGSESVSLVLPECMWEFDSMIEYGTKINQLPEQDRPIVIVLCDEAKAYQARMDYGSELGGFPFFWLEPFSLETVQHWLMESKGIHLAMGELIQVMERLCGWPAAVYRLGELLEEKKIFWADMLDQTVNDLFQRKTLQDFLPGRHMLLRPIVKVCAEYGESISCEEVHEFLEDESREIWVSLGKIEQGMEYMADYRLLNRTNRDLSGKRDRNDIKISYVIDKLVAELWEKQKHVF